MDGRLEQWQERLRIDALADEIYDILTAISSGSEDAENMTAFTDGVYDGWRK